MRDHPLKNRFFLDSPVRNLLLVIACILLLCLPTFAQDFPARPSGPVADYANVIDAVTRQKITTLAQALWDQAQFGLVVATLPSIGSSTIDEYAPQLYKQWGIGKKGSDEINTAFPILNGAIFPQDCSIFRV